MEKAFWRPTDHDEGIREEEEKTAAQQDNDTHQAYARGRSGDVPIGQLQKRRHMAAKIVDLIKPTENELENG